MTASCTDVDSFTLRSISSRLCATASSLHSLSSVRMPSIVDFLAVRTRVKQLSDCLLQIKQYVGYTTLCPKVQFFFSSGEDRLTKRAHAVSLCAVPRRSSQRGVARLLLTTWSSSVDLTQPGSAGTFRTDPPPQRLCVLLVHTSEACLISPFIYCTDYQKQHLPAKSLNCYQAVHSLKGTGTSGPCREHCP